MEARPVSRARQTRFWHAPRIVARASPETAEVALERTRGATLRNVSESALGQARLRLTVPAAERQARCGLERASGRAGQGEEDERALHGGWSLRCGRDFSEIAFHFLARRCGLLVLWWPPNTM